MYTFSNNTFPHPSQKQHPVVYRRRTKITPPKNNAENSGSRAVRMMLSMSVADGSAPLAV